MSFDFTSVQAIATQQVANFGTNAVLAQPTAPTGPGYDPTPGIPTEYSVKVVPGRFNWSDKMGGLVQQDDRMYLMSVEGDPDPDLKGTLTVEGVTLQVIKLETVRHAGVTIVWKVHCRK